MKDTLCIKDTDGYAFILPFMVNGMDVLLDSLMKKQQLSQFYKQTPYIQDR